MENRGFWLRSLRPLQNRTDQGDVLYWQPPLHAPRNPRKEYLLPQNRFLCPRCSIFPSSDQIIPMVRSQ